MATCAVLAAASAAAYGRTFTVPLLYDDDPSIAFNKTLHHLRTAFWPPFSSTVGGRPVLNVSLAINYAISGTGVWSYHAANLLIHFLAALTLFGVIRHALASAQNKSATPIAFSAALIWVLHPLQTESVTYVIQRAESLMALFYLLTLYFFIRGAEAKGPGMKPWFTLSCAACLLGMATKEVMVSVPLVALLYDRTFIAGSFREAWRKRSRVYAALGSTWLLLAFLVYSTHGRGGTAGLGSGISWWGYAVTQLPAIAHYLRLCFIPHPLVFDYGTHLDLSAIDVVPAALVVAALLAATIWGLIRKPAVGFLGACFFAVLAPSSSIVPVATETMAEHRMYLPLACVVLAVVLGLFKWLGNTALPLCAALACALAVVTWQRNEVYRSEEGIWRDTVSVRPENERAHNNLGYKLSTIPGRMGEAITQYEEALRDNPEYPDAHNNMGTALETIPGRLDEAISHYRDAVRFAPRYAEAYYNLGNALMGVPGRLDEAISNYEEALRLTPDFPEVQNNLGIALEQVPGRRDEAIAHYEEALRLVPDSVTVHFNLGCALEKMPGRLDDAVAQLRETLRLQPDYAKAHFYLGFALDRLPGHADEAIAQYEEALRLDPNLGQAHFNLGYALETMPGRLEEAVGHYEEAVRLMPNYAEAHSNLGNALKGLGRTSEAIDQYEEAVRLKPDDARIHLGLAILLLDVPGRTDEAIAHVREALRIQPDNVLARRIMAQAGSGQ